MREDALVGITSNPTIFQKAIADGDAYDEQLHDVLEHESDPKEVFLALASRDIQSACDLLRSTWEHTKHLDGQVLLEVDPALADDRDATIAEAQRLHQLVDRQNLLSQDPSNRILLGCDRGNHRAWHPGQCVTVQPYPRITTICPYSI